MSASSSMTFRLDADLQAAFLAACKANDRSGAQELRAFMRAYVERNAQGALPLASDAAPAKRRRGG